MLRSHEIRYLHFGNEFGARQTEPGLLSDDGKVDFERVQQTSLFLKGIQRLAQGLDKGFQIALMCSESDPLACHRFSMIAVALAANGFDVLHIVKDKTLLTQEAADQILIKKHHKKAIHS